MHCPEVLLKFDRANDFILVLSQYRQAIENTLQSVGLQEGLDYTFPATLAPNHIIMYCRNVRDQVDFVEWMNLNLVYAKLRWFDDFLKPNDDWDVLVQSSALDRILDSPLLIYEETPYAFDFKWDEPLGFEGEYLYYPPSISRKILESREFDQRGFYRVSSKLYPQVFSFHCVFQKSPGVTGLSDPQVALKEGPCNRFSVELERLSIPSGNLECLWELLGSANFIPPVSDGRRWARDNQSLFLAQKFAKSSRPDGSSVCVFTVRVGGDIPDLRGSVVLTATEFGLRLLGQIQLTREESAKLRESTRGGCWQETPASSKGGGPSRLIVFLDAHEDSRDGPFDFEVRRWRRLKEKIRAKYSDTAYDPSVTNWLHCADDHLEALETLKLLERERLGEEIGTYVQQ